MEADQLLVDAGLPVCLPLHYSLRHKDLVQCMVGFGASCFSQCQNSMQLSQQKRQQVLQDGKT